MIAHLSGTLLSKQATSVILDVGGVGYEVTIPLSTFYDLEDAGKPVQLRDLHACSRRHVTALRIQNNSRARVVSKDYFSEWHWAKTGYHIACRE